MTDINEVLAERGSRYGKFEDHARISRNLKDAMMNEPGWERLADDQKEALDMTQHKVARIINGDSNYLDSWVDIVGYVQLVINRLTGK
jgi:hypothetical protein